MIHLNKAGKLYLKRWNNDVPISLAVPFGIKLHRSKETYTWSRLEMILHPPPELEMIPQQHRSTNFLFEALSIYAKSY